MLDYLSINETAVTILGYPLSYIEFVGTVLYLASVWLIARRNMLTWPVGIVSVLLFMSLFYQIALYSDALEQVYYLAASVYGWIFWSRTTRETGTTTGVRYSARRGLIAWAAATTILSVALGFVMSRVHLLLPSVFKEPAAYPYVDAATTIMSFSAMWLLARKRIESWVYWIIVDVVGIALYFLKDVRFISLLYVILLVLATQGFLSWRRIHRQSSSEPSRREAKSALALERRTLR